MIIGTSQLFNEILNAVKQDWNPPDFDNELQYRDHLLKFLRREFPEERFKVESGRNRCDIEINAEIGLELKKDLRGKSNSDRLLGQIKGYTDEYYFVGIVLCGENNQSTIDKLKYDIDFYEDNSLSRQNVVEIIDRTFEYTEEEYEDDEEEDTNYVGLGFETDFDKRMRDVMW